MLNAFHRPGRLCLAIGLMLTATPIARAADAEEPPYYYKAPPRVGGNPLRGREGPADPLPPGPIIPPAALKEMLQAPPQFLPTEVEPAPSFQQPRLEQPDLGWVRYVVYALISLLGGWGTWKLPARSAAGDLPPRAHPPARQEPLGLGADGRGGFWLRQVFPWEQK